MTFGAAVLVVVTVAVGVGEGVGVGFRAESSPGGNCAGKRASGLDAEGLQCAKGEKASPTTIADNASKAILHILRSPTQLLNPDFSVLPSLKKGPNCIATPCHIDMR